MDKKPKRDIVRRRAELMPREVRYDLDHWRERALEAEAELAELQRIESMGNIAEQHRDRLVRIYLEKIEALNLTIPGGLRSQPLAEDGENQELVNEAYRLFCDRRRGGGRYGG